MIRGQVLMALKDDGPLSRIELARRTSVSPTTMTRIVSQLIDEGIVVDGNTVSSTGVGRPATEISLVHDAKVVVGVHILVGLIKVGIIDLFGKVLDSTEFEYDTGLAAETVIARTAQVVNTLIESSSFEIADILGIGVAVPGPVDTAGRSILLPINLNWRNVPVADLLEPLTELPVTVEHSVQSMALAEAYFGAGSGAESVAFIYLRAGLGAGIVVNAPLYAGGIRGAIELGHLHVIDNGAPCVCGSNGCIETIVGQNALRAMLEQAGVDPGERGALTALYESTAENPKARELIDEIVAHLATAISAVANIMNPEVIFLGGTLGEIPTPLRERVTTRTRELIFPFMRPRIRIETSSLGEASGVIGGGASALKRFFYSGRERGEHHHVPSGHAMGHALRK